LWLVMPPDRGTTLAPRSGHSLSTAAVASKYGEYGCD
jgi:hypothetical protein